MTIKVQETTTREIDVTFPHYSKTVAHYYKAISETSCIVVTRGWKDRQVSVDFRDYSSSAFDILNMAGTEQEFNEWFNTAMQILHNTVYPNDTQEAHPNTLCEEIKHNAKEKPYGL